MNKPTLLILAVAYSTLLTAYPLHARSENVTDLKGKTYFNQQRKPVKRQQALEKQRTKSRRKYLQDDFPVSVHNIEPIKDRSVKNIYGIMGNFIGYRGATIASGPVEGGRFRINFDIQNNTMEDFTVRVRYGNYWKDIYIEAAETLHREMISFTSKKYAISAEVGGQKRTYRVD